MTPRLPLRALAAALVALTVAGCAVPIPAVNSMSEVHSHEVAVVGEIVINPPLDEKDQNLQSIGSGQFKNKAYFVTDTKWREKTGPIDIGDQAFETTLGQPFYVKLADKPFYILSGVIYTDVQANAVPDSVNLPGGLRVNLHPNDRAVYIGTIRFTRNEYFDITKAQIIDDYARANAEFKKKFGVHYNLRKALVEPLSEKQLQAASH